MQRHLNISHKRMELFYLKINITEALNNPGRSIKFSCTKDDFASEIGEGNISFDSPLKVAGTLMYTGEDYIVKGDISISYKTQCDRCTKELGNSLEIDFYEEYAKLEDESHPDRYLFEQNEIDLELMVTDNIALMMPMKHLCDIDCKGLCPVCGGNLNDKDCGCLEEEMMKNSPFAKIKELNFDDDGEV